MLRSVAMLLLPDVSPFEFGTISEVFGMDRTPAGLPPIEFRPCGPVAGAAIPSTIGVGFTPPFGLEGLDGVDVVAVSATRMRDFPEPVLDAVRAAHERGATILAICSGAYVLGAAGLLDGRHCTTHWMHVDDLAARYPLARLDPDVLYVDEGDIVTSAGTAAGIDACLHLVRRELGGSAVNAIARGMVVPPQRDGGQRQFVLQPIPECSSDSLAPVLDWVARNLRVEHSVADLATRARMSERTFARRFAAETGTTPHKWITLQRVLRARELLEETDLPVDEIGEHAGFGGGALLRHHFRKAVGVSPVDYRRTFTARSVT